MRYQTIYQGCFKCGYETQFKIALRGEDVQFKGFTKELLTEETCPKCRAMKQIFKLKEKRTSVEKEYSVGLAALKPIYNNEKEEKENG